MSEVLTGPAPTVQRDRWGRPLIVPVGGGKPVAYTRATTVAKALDDMSGLMRWKQRMTALGIAQRRDLLTALAATSPEDKKTVDALVDQATEAAGASAAATTGTALHAFTERLDRGLDVGVVPAEHEADLAAYRATAAEVGWTVRDVELFTVLHTYKIAGTTDRVLEIDGRRYIADIKTSQTVDFPHAFAAQLAIYSRALPYDLEAGLTRGWDQIPDQERGLIIHLPARQGVCRLHWIDLTAGWEAVRLAMTVRKWRARRDLLTAYQSGPVDPVLAAIRSARTVTDLNRVWATHESSWTDEYTRAAAARKHDLTSL